MGKGRKSRRRRRAQSSRNVFAKLRLDEQAIELLNNYAMAFAHFYGRIDLRTALEIINEQNDNRFSEEQFLGFMKTKRRNKHNSSRLWANRGYTPAEMLALTGQS